MIEFQAPARPEAVLQKRGVERVQAILDAGEAILATDGYEAATLKAIGERAGIPLASIYHYFADRHQVDLAILQRHLHALDDHVRSALDTQAIATMADAIDSVIEPMLAYFRAHPSCIELWFSHQRDATLTDLVKRYDDETARYLWELAQERRFLRGDTPLLVMELAFEAGSQLFDSAFRRLPTGDDAVIDEARRMVGAYLDTYAS
jgi:AcrR family transcriptional regulator